MAVIGGFRSDLSLTRKPDGNLGNVSANGDNNLNSLNLCLNYHLCKNLFSLTWENAGSYPKVFTVNGFNLPSLRFRSKVYIQ